MLTFIEELNLLALTVSVVNEENWRDISTNLDTYFSEKVGASYWEICVSGVTVNNAPGLKSIAPGSESTKTYTLRRDKNRIYEDYRALALTKDQPVWIVEKDGKNLRDTNVILVDKWSGLHEDNDFPKSIPEKYNSQAKTILFHPLKFQGNVFGVFVLEHEQLKLLTREMQTDVTLTCEALSRIVRVWQTTREQTDALRTAGDRFRKFVNSASSITDRKKIFVASPKNRDQNVWKAIGDVLKKHKFKNRFEIIKWDEKTVPGNIVSQIFKDARETTVGICLISENISQDKGKPFANDNVNVIFEAGVFQTLVDSPDQVCKALVAIREDVEIAGRPFFDLAQDRLCIIDRDDNHKFLAKEFREKLEKMIEEALSL